MSLFARSENEMAFLKAGFMGFQGSGKTMTATLVAIGLHQLLKSKRLPGSDSPIYMVDTETGSDWVKRDCDEAGIELVVSKTRAFKNLVPLIEEVQQTRSILIIDSITHFWRDLTESYARKKNRKYGLQFQDWAWLKEQWGHFTDAYVNANAHILLCGRAGHEYSHEDNEDGRKELIKTGVKMKAEGETGYEPSILVLMERHQELVDGTPKITRRGVVLKDRSRLLDGAMFVNPTFEDFRPHIECLNLGGVHRGVDTEENSESLVPEREENYAKQREVCLDEIKEEISRAIPGMAADQKKKKSDLLQEIFNTRAWSKVETMTLMELLNGRERIWQTLNGHSYDQAGEARQKDVEEQAELTF